MYRMCISSTPRRVYSTMLEHLQLFTRLACLNADKEISYDLLDEDTRRQIGVFSAEIGASEMTPAS